jgi:tetratricopeptide (TPR) repeat protein
MTMKTVALTLVLFIATMGTARGQSDEAKHREALQHYRAGQELMSAEKFGPAAEEFIKAIDLDPLLTLAHYGLGQAYMGLQRYASAVLAFNGCKAAYERLANMRQTDAFRSDRNTDDEISSLRDQLVAIRSGMLKGAAGGPAAEARIESRLGELEGMKRGKRFENGGTAVPGEVHLALGSAYYRNNQRPEAEASWQAAVKANPKLGEGYSNLAVIYMMTGRKKEAQDSIKAAEKANFRVNPQLKADINKMPNGEGASTR